MRRHPIVRRYRMHTGIDWAAPTGTPIMAGGDGVVEKIGTRAGYGRSITLKHLHGYETTYNHMSGYLKGLKRGDKIAQGQVIGNVDEGTELIRVRPLQRVGDHLADTDHS